MKQQRKKFLNCENIEELEKLFDTLYDKYFLNYNLKIKEFKEKVIKEDDFKNLSLDEQKKIFLTMLDLNQMYVNKTEMADKKFCIDKKDQKLTKEFIIQTIKFMTKNNQIIIYQTKSGKIELRKDVQNETVWASRMQMAEIFDVNPQAVSKHILKIYKEGELEKKATSSKMELVQNESGRTVKRQIDYYNLEMLISVGYRINSIKGTKFRQWATKNLETTYYTRLYHQSKKNKTKS